MAFRGDPLAEKKSLRRFPAHAGGFAHYSTSFQDGATPNVDSMWSTTGSDLLHIAFNINAAPPDPDTEVALNGGILTIADINGGDSNDNLTLSYAGGIYTLTWAGTHSAIT